MFFRAMVDKMNKLPATRNKSEYQNNNDFNSHELLADIYIYYYISFSNTINYYIKNILLINI